MKRMRNAGFRRFGRDHAHKRLGGIAVVQSPAALPLVDFVLRAAEMPQRRLDVWTNATHIRLPAKPGSERAQGEVDSTFLESNERASPEIMTMLRTRTGHDFRHYKTCQLSCVGSNDAFSNGFTMPPNVFDVFQQGRTTASVFRS
jgi:two-component system CheB/CheR fusion protein